jgi:hypothetical protein
MGTDCDLELLEFDLINGCDFTYTISAINKSRAEIRSDRFHNIRRSITRKVKEALIIGLLYGFAIGMFLGLCF